MATWPTITDDDGSNTTGTVVNNTNVWNPIRDYIGGAWTSVAYAGGNFTADTGSWTVASGDQTQYAYVEIGKTMHVAIFLVTTTAASSPTNLRVAVPNGRTIARTIRGPFVGANAGTDTTSAFWEATSGATHIKFYRNLSANAWSGTDNITICALCTFEIQ